MIDSVTAIDSRPQVQSGTVLEKITEPEKKRAIEGTAKSLDPRLDKNREKHARHRRGVEEDKNLERPITYDGRGNPKESLTRSNSKMETETESVDLIV